MHAVAYGDGGSGDKIPGGSTLVFEVMTHIPCACMPAFSHPMSTWMYACFLMCMLACMTIAVTRCTHWRAQVELLDIKQPQRKGKTKKKKSKKKKKAAKDEP